MYIRRIPAQPEHHHTSKRIGRYYCIRRHHLSPGADQTALQQIGSLTLWTFPNLGGLNAIGGNLYQQTDASGAGVSGSPGLNGFGTVVQGYVELSNVNVMTEMVNLIIGQRAYEANSKAIQAADQMLQMANNVRQG